MPCDDYVPRQKLTKRATSSKANLMMRAKIFKGTITLAKGDVMKGKFHIEVSHWGYHLFGLLKGSIKFSNGDTLEKYDDSKVTGTQGKGTIRYADGGVFRGRIRMRLHPLTYKTTLQK